MSSTSGISTAARLSTGPLAIDPLGLAVTGPARSIRLEPKVMDVLVALAESPGEVVSRDHLFETIWRGIVVSDECLTRAISQIRRAIQDAGGDGVRIETVPKRGYRLVASGADAIAEHPSPSARRAPPSKGLLAFFAAAAGALMSGAVLASALFLADREPPVELIAAGRFEVSAIAVIGDDAGLADVASALGVQIISSLASNDVETAPGEGAGARAISEFAIKGALQREGAQLRATIDLYDKPGDAVVWSRAFTRSADEAFALRDQVAAKIADVARCGLKLRGDRFDMPMHVWRLYLKYCDVRHEKGGDSAFFAPFASDATRKILAADPDSATAMALHAQALWVPVAFTESLVGDARLMSEARSLATAALKRAPHSAEADFVASTTAAGVGFESADGEKRARLESILLRLVRDHPDHYWSAYVLGQIYRKTGRISDAVKCFQVAASADPYDPVARTRLGLAHAMFGEKAEALAQFDRVEREFPDNSEPYQRRYEMEAYYGDPDAALALVQSGRVEPAMSDPADKACNLAFVHARIAGSKDATRVDEDCTNFDPLFRTRMFAALGDLDRAYAEADLLNPADHVSIGFFYPDMRAFVRDPRFWPLAEKHNLVDYWLAAGQWPDFCSERELPFDCRERALAAKSDRAARMKATPAQAR